MLNSEGMTPLTLAAHLGKVKIFRHIIDLHMKSVSIPPSPPLVSRALDFALGSRLNACRWLATGSVAVWHD